MRILSINTSRGTTVQWNGKPVETGIFKTPIQGSVRIRALNVDGDRQSDLSVHGGADKAIYSYDQHDYTYWEAELKRPLTPGMFGENLTTEGLLDREICAGDVIAAGDAVLQATQPRLPCFKLSVKFLDDQMPKRFVRAARWGIYFRVVEEGDVETGNEIRIVSRDPRGVTIDALAKLALGQAAERKTVLRALEIPSLTEGWREMLNEMLERPGKLA